MFAQTGCLQGLASNQANATEPERTPNLAILATGSVVEPGPASFSANPALERVRLGIENR
jgi:hypothetical protein